MKVSEAIAIAAEFIANADQYQTKHVEARYKLEEFSTKWGNTIDALGEADPGAILNELLEYIKKRGGDL